MTSLTSARNQGGHAKADEARPSVASGGQGTLSEQERDRFSSLMERVAHFKDKAAYGELFS